MKHLYFILLVAAITLTSCKNEEAQQAQPDARTIVPFTQQTAAAMQNQAAQTPAAQTHNFFHENNQATTASVVDAKTITAKGMNPPHGEKNHRCDIAVGAPLNSDPKATATTTEVNSATTEPKDYTVQQAVPALLSTAAADTQTAVGMNPAHGKTGHRCDIAVGAPLPKS